MWFGYFHCKDCFCVLYTIVQSEREANKNLKSWFKRSLSTQNIHLHTQTNTFFTLLNTMASSSLVLFQKEIYKFQNEYIKEIIDNLEIKELMTPELTEFFKNELDRLDNSVKEEIKKTKKQMKKSKKEPSEKKEKTPRQVLLGENMSYVRTMYKDTGVVQTNVMTCAQYMTTKMMNDQTLPKYDALLEAIKEVNEKRGETVFEIVPNNENVTETDETGNDETGNDETETVQQTTDNEEKEGNEEPKLEEEVKPKSKKTMKKKTNAA